MNTNNNKHTDNNIKAWSSATSCTTRSTARVENKAQEGKDPIVLTTIDSLNCYMNIKETSREASRKLLESVKASSQDLNVYTYRETDEVYEACKKREQETPQGLTPENALDVALRSASTLLYTGSRLSMELDLTSGSFIGCMKSTESWKCSQNLVKRSFLESALMMALSPIWIIPSSRLL
jgi:hypothetical protein